jgi:hypothetical protein
MFKEILETLQPSIIVGFLNSVFKRNMPIGSIVESLRTESNTGNRTIADYILKVTETGGTVRFFHVEA